jgi:trk system potassium uptake protein TrkA
MERFAVIGMGRFGRRLAVMLSEAGADVIAIDRQREVIEQIRDQVTLAVSLDSTDEEALRAQGIDKVDVAVVGIGTAFEAAALTTVILKQLGVPRVISRATSEVRAQVLSRIGADDIVNPEKESAERWANRLLAPAVIERIELAEGYSLAQVPVPESFHGKTLEQLAIRRRYQVNVVAIRRTTEEPDEAGQVRSRQFVITGPMADSVIQRGDVLVIIGGDDAISAFPANG